MIVSWFWFKYAFKCIQIDRTIYVLQSNQFQTIKKLCKIPCSGGKCISSKSPCVTAINHQIIAKKSQERTKLRANTIRVHLHWLSTSVVNISCRNRILRLEIFFCNTLQSLQYLKSKSYLSRKWNRNQRVFFL